MNSAKQVSSRMTTRIGVAAMLAIVAGLVLVVLSIGLEWRGFVGGTAIGAGVAFMAVAAYFWGFVNGLHRAGRRGAWRPSEDSLT